MKKVLSSQKRINKKYFWRIFILLFINLVGFSLFSILIFAFAFINSKNFWPTQTQWVFLLIYPYTIGIIVNLTFHIIYTELGNSWWRLLMWVHSALIVVLISIIVFNT